MFICLKGRNRARVRTKEKKNGGDRMSAHKKSFNLKSKSYRGGGGGESWKGQ